MKLVKLKCTGCDLEFEKQTKEYNRQIKNGNKAFYCSSKCCGKYNARFRIKTVKVNRICLYCNSSFLSTTHKRYKKCCSVSCAKKYSQSFIDPKIISNSLINFNKNSKKEKYSKCIICSNLFNYKWNKKTCSLACYKKLVSLNSTTNPNCGGETNYKKYKYNNVWMDSSWEVTLAKWLDDNQISWKRDRTIKFYWTDLENKKRRYYPDFYLPTYNIYVDPKNKFKLEKDRYKLNQVVKENNITLIYGSLLDVIKSLKSIINNDRDSKKSNILKIF